MNAKVHGDPHQSFLMPFAPLRVKASGDRRAGTPRSLHLCPMLAPVFSPVVKKILAEKYVAVDLCPAPVTLCWTVLAHYMCTCPCTCMRLLMECPPQLAFCSKHWFSSCPAFAIVRWRSSSSLEHLQPEGLFHGLLQLRGCVGML